MYNFSTPLPASEIDEELSNLQTEPLENLNNTSLVNGEKNKETTNEIEPTASASKQEEEIVNDQV